MGVKAIRRLVPLAILVALARMPCGAGATYAEISRSSRRSSCSERLSGMSGRPRPFGLGGVDKFNSVGDRRPEACPIPACDSVVI